MGVSLIIVHGIGLVVEIGHFDKCGNFLSIAIEHIVGEFDLMFLFCHVKIYFIQISAK